MFSFLGQGVLGELLAPTKTPGQQLHQAIEDGLNEKAMRLIHDEKIDFNSPDPSREDCLPIHTACKAGNEAMLDSLLQLGADINAKDRHGSIPLHYAARHSRVDLVKKLVAQGADVARRNAHRQTPYDMATNHVIRQYLLPLQLRAEPEPAPNSLLAVHNPDIVRDYSNLPPPPTSIPAPQAVHAPPPGGPTPLPNYNIRPGGWNDPAVTRPIAADGFHSSAGDPELAAKYGHIKTNVPIVARPGGGAQPQPGQPAQAPQPQQPQQQQPAQAPMQYSAFANGRPMPRYVAYDAVNGNTAPAYGGPPMGQMGQRSTPPPLQHVPPQQQAAPIMVVAPPQQPLGAPQGYPSYSPPPPQQAVAPPLRQPVPTATGIPTLPSPNAISVFQPLPDSGEDAIALDGSVSKVA